MERNQAIQNLQKTSEMINRLTGSIKFTKKERAELDKAMDIIINKTEDIQELQRQK